jgi:hypothetical protein
LALTGIAVVAVASNRAIAILRIVVLLGILF